MYGERGHCGTKPAVVRDRDNGWKSDFFVAVLWRITLNVNTVRANLAISDDSGEPKAVKSLGASLCVHVINGRVQGVEASFSCCTNSSSNLASYYLQ